MISVGAFTKMPVCADVAGCFLNVVVVVIR